MKLFSLNTIKCICLILVLSLGSISYAQLRSLNIGSVEEKNYLSVIRFEMMGDKLIVPVTIKGKSYRFLFDTGAPNIISKELDSLLQPNKIGSLNTTDATGKRKPLKVVSVETLTFGDVQFKETATLVYDLQESAVFQCFKIDGFIGSNMLRKSIVQIDSKTKTIIITDNKRNLSLNKKESSKLTLTKNQSSPYVWINLKGKETGKEQLLIDTGADGVYDLSKEHFAYFQEKEIFEPIAKAEGASSISLFGDAPINTQYKLLLPALELNSYEFKDVVTTTTNDNNSRVGATILQYGKITIDYKNKRFYFHPHENPEPVVYYDYGFSNTYLNDKLSIGFVWDEALREKIAFGDEVLEVNGYPINESSLCDLVGDVIMPRTKELMTLKIKNQSGEVNEFTFQGTILKSKS